MVRKVKTLITDFFTQFSKQKKHFTGWYQSFEQSANTLSQRHILQNHALLKPLIFVGAILTTIVSSGIAIGAFFTLIFSLLFIYFVMTKIFGIELGFHDVVIV